MDVHNKTINELSVKSNERHTVFQQLIKEKTSTIKDVVHKEWKNKNSRLLSLMGLLLKDFYIFVNYAVDTESTPRRVITLKDTITEYKIKCIFYRYKDKYGDVTCYPSCVEFYRNNNVCEYRLTSGPLDDIDITEWLDIRERVKQWTEYLNIFQGVVERYYNDYIDKTKVSLDFLQSL